MSPTVNEQLRQRALELAADINHSVEDVVTRAEAYYAFIKGE